MINRYILMEVVREKFTPIIEEFIVKVEAFDYENDKDVPEIDLSNTEINPYTLQELLEGLGYEEDEDGMDRNGWQMDFWLKMHKPGYRTLQIRGCGITFELKLLLYEE